MALAGSAQAKAFTDLFIFGDSYSDTGAYVPLTNGTTAAAYLAALYGIPLVTSKATHPGTQGVNFAESGARVDKQFGTCGPLPAETSDSKVAGSVYEEGLP